MKKILRILFSVALVQLLSAGLTVSMGQGKKIDRTFNWSYNTGKEAVVEVDNYDCDIVIHTWNKAEVKYEMSIDASMKSDEDARVLEKYIESLRFSNSASHVSISNRFWNSRNNIVGIKTMKLEGGKTVRYNELEIEGELWIPETARLEISSKYSGIEIEKTMADIELDLYNDKLSVAGCNEVEIIAKYSTIELKDNTGINADLYNCELYTGATKNVTIESKYSKVYGSTAEILDLESYNDKFTFETTGNIRFVSKYSDLKARRSGKLVADNYEGTITIDEPTDVDIISKYSKYEFVSVSNCNIESIYNSRITASGMRSLNVTDSKYCTYEIRNLGESAIIRSGYEDKVYIIKAGNDFKGLALNGKYIKSEIGLAAGTDYRFRADIKYPHLEMDEESLSVKIKIVESSQLKYDAVMGTERDDMPVIEITGYDMYLKIIKL